MPSTRTTLTALLLLATLLAPAAIAPAHAVPLKMPGKKVALATSVIGLGVGIKALRANNKAKAKNERRLQAIEDSIDRQQAPPVVVVREREREREAAPRATRARARSSSALADAEERLADAEDEVDYWSREVARLRRA